VTRTSPLSVNLMALPTRVEEHLGEALFVANTNGQGLGHLGLERKSLVLGQRRGKPRDGDECLAVQATLGRSRAGKPVNLFQQSRKAVLAMHASNQPSCSCGFDTGSRYVERLAAFAAINAL
jgi:hypothetical protein